MNELQRHRLAFKLIVPVISVFMKLRFGYECDDLRKVEGPYLLVANHNMELDPASVGVAVRNPLYFVASEHIARKGLGTWFIMTFFKPILHRKGKQGINTVKQMIKTLKAGHSVCIFPEGNRSFNGVTGEILPAIGKVAKTAGVRLVTYRFEGGYLTQPRWSLTWRRGKLRGRLIRIYEPEDLKEMSGEEVYQAICDDLYEDAYETQKKEPIAFRGRKPALGMESTVFVCPKCRQIGKLHTDHTKLYCACGFEAAYDVYGYLTDQEKQVYTLTELDLLQREELKSFFENCEDGKLLFSDEVALHQIDKDHQLISVTQGVLGAYKDRLECCGSSYAYGDVQGMAIYSRNTLVLHLFNEEGHLEIKGKESFNALKYMYLYELERKGE